MLLVGRRLPTAARWLLPSTSTLSGNRCASLDGIDRSSEKPEPFHLEHVKQRLAFTVPQMFRQRMDYTFYRSDVIYDDHIFRLRRQGLHNLMQHFGTIAVLGNFFFPHVEMEVGDFEAALSIHPVMEDGTVRLRWRVKYVSFPRLLTHPKLFRFDYRIKNLSWFDGYSVFSVDGNGDVYLLTIQKMRRDEGLLTASTKKLAEKIGVLPGTTNFVKTEREEQSDKKSN